MYMMYVYHVLCLYKQRFVFTFSALLSVGKKVPVIVDLSVIVPGPVMISVS